MSQIEITKDEIDQHQFDATMVQGLDPSKHYRWVKKTPVNVTRKGLQGYVQTVRTPELRHVVDTTTPMKKGEDISSAIEWGDMILMEMPKEVFEDRLNRKRARILRQTKGVAQAYRAAIARMSEGAGQKNLGFEEHTDTGGYSEGVSEAEFNRKMQEDPELDGPRVGRVKR